MLWNKAVDSRLVYSTVMVSLLRERDSYDTVRLNTIYLILGDIERGQFLYRIS